MGEDIMPLISFLTLVQISILIQLGALISTDLVIVELI